MFLGPVLIWMLILLGLIWLAVDVVFPLWNGKPAFQYFRRSPKKTSKWAARTAKKDYERAMRRLNGIVSELESTEKLAGGEVEVLEAKKVEAELALEKSREKLTKLGEIVDVEKTP